MEKIKVAIVDDHQIVRDGIMALLYNNDRIVVTGEAGGSDELMQLLERQTPDIVILDISMPERSGVEIARELKEKHERPRILMLSANADEENIVEAIRAGADGFLSKDTSKEELIEAITQVHGGEEYFGARLSKIIFKSYTQHLKAGRNDGEVPELSKRETSTLILLSDGLSTKEIAEKLHISPRTVECNKSNILGKLNLKTNADLIKYAIRQGIVRL